MTTKRNCKKGYNCGRACISIKKACIVDGLKGQSVSIANLLTQQIRAIKNKSYVSPVASSRRRAFRRRDLINEYFQGKEDLAIKYENRITDLIKDKTVKMAVFSEVVKKIRNNDGQIKNQHEIGKSNGFYNPKKRARVEKEYFGYNQKDKSLNPKYGFVDTDSDYENVAIYGDEIYETNQLDYNHYTVTLGDSLSSEIYGSRANDVKIESIREQSLKKIASSELPTKFEDLNVIYVEAQIGAPLDINMFNKIADVSWK